MDSQNLDFLRNEMKITTSEIFKLINQRMELAKKIGEIKTSMKMEVVDDRVEQNIKQHLIDNNIIDNSNIEFSGRIVNLLIEESKRIQTELKSSEYSKGIKGGNIVNSVNKLQNPGNNLTNISKKSNEFEIKNHMDVFNIAKQLDEKGVNIIHMEVGELDLSPPPDVKDELLKSLEKGRYHYTQPTGINQLRKRLAVYLDNINNKNPGEQSKEISFENILVTPGGRFGIFNAFSTILRPGDEIVTIEPVWPAYQDCANYLGVKTRSIKTNMEKNWEPDISKIEELVNINTKIICLNYPNNPTGKILPKKLLHQIIDIAKKNDIFILSDEVYNSYSYKPFHSIVSFDYPKSILIGSFSKSYAMTGFRIGYVFSPNKDLINKMKKFQSLSLTSVAEPIQYCAIAAIDSPQNKYVETVKRRLDILRSNLEKMPFKYIFPDGGMYIFAKIDENLNINDLGFVEKLLKEGVAIAPGRGFGMNYFNYLRFSACIDELKLKEGMEIIKKIISSF